MAISTKGTVLTVKKSDNKEIEVKIKSFPDLGVAPAAIDVTSLAEKDPLRFHRTHGSVECRRRRIPAVCYTVLCCVQEWASSHTSCGCQCPAPEELVSFHLAHRFRDKMT